MTEKKYNFVYKTTNNINGDYYYGVHSTDNLDDGYMGSGLRLGYSINKYGIENFTREYIQFFNCRKDAYLFEAKIVSPELLTDTHCLNIAIGGQGGFVTANYSDAQRTVLRKKQSEGRKNYYNKLDKPIVTWNKGKHNVYSNETLEKIGSKQRGRKRSQITIERNKNSKKNRIWINDNVSEKWIDKSKLDIFLSKGWQFGRVKRK